MSLKTLLLASLAALGVATPAQHQKRDATYDYVIIGLVLAERLTENPAITVAVIEAGSYYQITDPVLSSTPAGDVFWCGPSPASTQPLVDWNFVTTPQAGANGRSIHYARGKCLGGSSARHFMIYQRGTIGSYDVWANAVGDQSYTFNGLLPYFKKGVHFTPPKSTRAPNASAEYNPAAFDPAGGPLQVSYANYAGPFSSWMEGSLNEIGIPDAQDFNSGSLLGAQYCSSTINPPDERRSSSQTSYLSAAVQGRSNLKIYTVTTAKQILFDANKRATGVKVVSAGFLLPIPFTVYANKEVILSAGAFQSPQMLMVSGIGAAATLQGLGIKVISNLPGVGQNMIDHIFFGPTYRVKVQTFTRLANDLIYTAAQYIGPYLLQQLGPLTNPVCDYLGWEKVPAFLRNLFTPSALADLATLPADWPELEYLSAPGYVGDFSDLPTTQPKDGYQYATIMAGIVAPFSRGNVTIVSTDTSVLPVINPNWLTSTTDQQVAIAGFKRTRQAFKSNYMQPVLADKNEYYPGAAVATDPQILNYIRNTLMTIWHASGTCKMGKATDPTAVVDTLGRVFGVTALRVIDVSVFPILPPGHPQSTVYAIAEKLAAAILAGS